MYLSRKFDSWGFRYSYIPIYFAPVPNKNTFLQETSNFVFFFFHVLYNTIRIYRGNPRLTGRIRDKPLFRLYFLSGLFINCVLILSYVKKFCGKVFYSTVSISPISLSFFLFHVSIFHVIIPDFWLRLAFITFREMTDGPPEEKSFLSSTRLPARLNIPSHRDRLPLKIVIVTRKWSRHQFSQQLFHWLCITPAIISDNCWEFEANFSQ